MLKITRHKIDEANSTKQSSVAFGTGIRRRTETSSSSIPMNIDRSSIRTPLRPRRGIVYAIRRRKSSMSRNERTSYKSFYSASSRIALIGRKRWWKQRIIERVACIILRNASRMKERQEAIEMIQDKRKHFLRARLWSINRLSRVIV